ncbi:MAG: glycosyltransferase [Candidatus Hodarchaeota archaeon]
MNIEFKTNPSPELPPASIIIPVYNGMNHIGKCLKSLLELEYPFFETIVVDDGSTDGTCMIINDFFGKMSNLFLIRSEKNQGSAYARNQGVKQARFDILVFLDADCVVDKNWLKNLVEKVMETGTCAAGRIETVNSGISRWADEEDKRWIEWKETYNIFHKRGFRWGLSGIFGIQRTLFDDIGEFDEILSRRVDGDYFIRLFKQGIKVVFVPSAVVFHHHPTSLRSYFRRGVAVAKATYLLNQKYGDPFRDTYRKRIHETQCFMVCVALLIILAFTKEYMFLSFFNPVVLFLFLLLLFFSFMSDLKLPLQVLLGKKSISGAILDFVQHLGEKLGYLISMVFRKKYWKQQQQP